LTYYGIRNNHRTMSKNTIIVIGPMNIPLSLRKGAVEEIIWQTSIRLRKYFNICVFNPSASSSFQKIINSLALMLKKDILKSNHVILHSHSAYVSLGISMFQVNNKHILHVLTLHTLPWLWMKKLFNRRLLTFNSSPHIRGYFKFLHRKKVFIIAPSLAIFRWLRTIGYTKVVYIPNGVDTKLFNPLRKSENVRKLLKAEDKVLITYVARVMPIKNQLALIKAVKELINEYNNLKVLFIGPYASTYKENGEKSKQYYRLLQQYIEKHGLRNVIEFLGNIPREYVAKILASSDIYVHPSLVEAAPLSILEAMASGLPIIAFRMPFYKGYLVHGVNCILVKPNDIRGLSSSILTLIHDKKLRIKISQKALKLAQEKFSWDIIVQKYRKVYLELFTENSNLL